jgi:hypothetical protein
MFQFAFAYLQARKLGTSFLMDINDQAWELFYFRLTTPYRLLAHRGVRRVYNFLQKKWQAERTINMEDCFIKHSYEGLPDGTYFIGYYQDYSLYRDHLEPIRELFAVRAAYREAFDRIYRPLLEKEKAIVISFRVGDYKQFDLFHADKGGVDIIVPFEWYHRVLSTMDTKGYKIYCMSDEIAVVKEQFRPDHPSVHYVEDNVITQLLLMQHADICILSNSTFAWWGGILNTKAEKIICPRYFLGFSQGKEIPPGIYPEHWEQVDVLPYTKET